MVTRGDLAALGSSDPAEALSAVRRLRRLLEDAEVTAVTSAREQGFSWQRIAELLGRSRSSVWERFNDLDTPPPTDAK